MSLLQTLFKSSSERESSARDAAIADPLIDRIVAASDRRLGLVKGCRETLRAPVLAARERLGALIARIPGPTEVSPGAWSRDDTVRALFARADDAAAAFSNDAGTRAFFAAHPAGDCIAMLALERVDRRVLASALQGDSVQAEVARTTVSFTAPQILAPCTEEAATRAELVARAIEYLAMRATHRVGAMRAERHALETERALLQAQLQLARRRGAGFGAMGSTVGSAAAVERDLERVVQALEASASKALLPVLLDAIVDVLAKLEEHLAIEPAALALDAMNFAVPEGTPGAIRPQVAALRLADRPPYAIVIARFPRADLRAERRFDDAAKFL